MSPERWAARPEVLRDVSEWAAQELVVALSISAQAAETLLVRSLTLVHRLPGTLAALEAGALHPGHLWPMLEKVAPIENDAVRAEVEAELLRWSAGRVTTPASSVRRRAARCSGAMPEPPPGGWRRRSRSAASTCGRGAWTGWRPSLLS